MKQIMNILQYNIQSLRKNKNNLEFYINKWNINICILSEIFNFDENESASFIPNFNIIVRKRQDNYGGVAIALKKDIKFKKINLNTPLDIIICETTNLSTNFTIVSVYFPHSVKGNEIKNELFKLLTFLNGKSNVIIAGDFNARNKDFGDSFTTVRGKAVKTIFDDSIFRCINTGKKTFKKSLTDNSQGSVLDLTFTNIASDISWEATNTTIGGSHHYPIIIKINNCTTKPKQFLAKRHLLKSLMKIKLTPNIHEIQSTMQSTIKNSTFKISQNKIPKPWWDENVERCYRLKVAAQKSFDLCKSGENSGKLLQALKNLTVEINKAKSDANKRKRKQINNSPNSKLLFRYIANCKNTFNVASNSKWCSENNNKYLIHLKSQIPPITQKIDTSVFMDDTHKFSLEEFLAVLEKKKKPSSAGLDGITYEMLNQLSIESKKTLLSALNNVWETCQITEEWRKIKIVPIPKRGKDLEIYTNFRPIALISVTLKILNLMIKNRINNFVEDTNILPARSYAYRKHRSASMCINDLLHTISTLKENKQKVLILSLDVAQAYEAVDIAMLLKIMEELKLPSQIITWIKNFLCKRVLVLGQSNLEINNGVPQGSCLSPILFNIYTMGLHGIADNNTQIFQFADDFIILCASKHFDDANITLQNKLNQFITLLGKLNLKINREKTSVMYVAKGGIKKPILMCQGNRIPITTKMKFLGRHIKNSLTMKEHYEDVINSCSSSLNAVKIVTNLKNGISPPAAVNLTKSLIFSKTEYAISSMAHMPTYINKKLKSFQNQILRRSLGLTPSTPVHTIYALALVLPPELRSKYLSAKELIKMKIFNPMLYESITSQASKKSSLGFIYLEFKEIFDNTIISNNIAPSDKTIIDLNTFKSSKANTAKVIFEKIYLEKLNNLKAEGFCIWSTDASINMHSTGCAACNISSNQNFLFKIDSKVSSLTGELHAIKKAIDLIVEDGISKAAIFTDSKNACLLLQNNTAHNYLVTNILQQINTSKISKLTLIWTPAHIGITANETADYYAKHAATHGAQINTKLSVRDAYMNIYNKLWAEWTAEFQQLSGSKGSFFYQFFNHPPKQHWHKGMTLTPENIKIVNRLYAGHTYSKKYLNMIGIQPTNLCDECNIIEDEKHIIFACKKYNSARLNYKIFNKYQNLPTLLAKRNKDDIIELCKFIHSCKIEL